MPLQVVLNIVTLVMCIITLSVATAALLPQIKAGLVLLRDLLLWTSLAGFLGFVGIYGWARLVEIKSENWSDETVERGTDSDAGILEKLRSLGNRDSDEAHPQRSTRSTDSFSTDTRKTPQSLPIHSSLPTSSLRRSEIPPSHRRPTATKRPTAVPFKANRSRRIPSAEQPTKAASLQRYPPRTRSRTTSTQTVPLGIQVN